jgi:hypothetical protein
MKINNISASLLVIFLSLWMMTGCDEIVEDPSKEELIAKNWKVTNVSAENGVISESYKDYTFNIKSDYTFSFMMASAMSGVWELSQDTNYLYLTEHDGNEIDVEIVSLTDTQLVLRFEAPNFKSPERKLRFELVAR